MNKNIFITYIIKKYTIVNKRSILIISYKILCFTINNFKNYLLDFFHNCYKKYWQIYTFSKIF